MARNGVENRGDGRGEGGGWGEHRGAAAPGCGTEIRYRLLWAAGRGGTGLRHRSGCCRPPVRGDRGAPMAEHRAAVQDNSYHSGAAAGTGMGWHRAPVGADVDPIVADNETNSSTVHQKGAGFVHCRDCHVPLWPEAVPPAPCHHPWAATSTPCPSPALSWCSNGPTLPLAPHTITRYRINRLHPHPSAVGWGSGITHVPRRDTEPPRTTLCAEDTKELLINTRRVY